VSVSIADLPGAISVTVGAVLASRAVPSNSAALSLTG
jgi:hypothetical protein